MQACDNAGIKGRFKIQTLKAGTDEVLSETPWYDNLVMKSANRGVNIVAQRLIGNKTYDLEIDSAEIGTSSQAVNEADTDLIAPVTTGILRATQEVLSTNVASIEFFISDADLPDGTYRELGLRAGTQLMARALFPVAYSKGSGQDTKILYQLTVNN